MKIKTAMPVILIVLIFSATSAFAWGHNGKRSNCDGRGNGMNYEQFEDRMENRLERMTVILDLTDDQKKQMEDLAENHWKERQELRKKMQASRDEMREYRSDKTFNVDEFRAKARQQADLKADMMAQRVQHRNAKLSILTPEQREKAEKLWDMRGDHHGKRGFSPDCDRECGKRAGSGCRNNS